MSPSDPQTEPLEVGLSGMELINHSLLNKGTAFPENERREFFLDGLLPPTVGTLDKQVERRMKALRGYQTDFEKYVFLHDLQDVNETLFYALLVRHIEELLPLVYTPTVGEGCQRFSEIWKKPRGLFLSYNNRGLMEEILSHPRYDKVRAIVVSDGERILGLGDQGAGGMGIPIGKLSLYTALAGIHPEQTLPILLDVGTDNGERLDNPLYLGWRHERVRGQDYDDFIELFVRAVMKRWPHVLLQWEDFAGSNAGRLIDRYRDRLCTFNDDIDGTASVAAGTLMSAINVTGIPMRDQKIVLFGAGSAGTGICSLIHQAMREAGLTSPEASARFFAVDREGLLVEGDPAIRPAQELFVRKKSDLSGWTLEKPGFIGLLDVVKNAKPTVLIGVSTQPGAFTEQVVRAMAAHCERPVIFPLSNPSTRCEAAPADLVKWTDGRALIGTGSPFPAVEWKGQPFPVNQTNNSYIFPGVALGVLVVKARRVTEPMFMAAAKALADLSPALQNKKGRLLPPVSQLRSVSAYVAMAVALQAQKEGLAEPCDEETLGKLVHGYMWDPAYRPYVLKKS